MSKSGRWSEYVKYIFNDRMRRGEKKVNLIAVVI